MSASVPLQLTPLESLCLSQVQFWVSVVEKNQGRCGRLVEGRPFTRLPAQELVSNLEQRFPFLSVTVRQVRRALNRLVELQLLVREQFWQKERWRSDYWYSVPETTAEVAEPRSDLSVTPESPEGEQQGVCEVTPSLKPLPSCLPEKTNGREDGSIRTKTAQQPSPPAIDKGKVRCGPEVASDGLRAISEGSPQARPTSMAQRPSEGPVRGRLSSLSAVVARCWELAGLVPGEEPDPLSNPSRRLEGDLVTEVVKVNGCLYRVSDPLSTIPLR